MYTGTSTMISLGMRFPISTALVIAVIATPISFSEEALPLEFDPPSAGIPATEKPPNLSTLCPPAAASTPQKKLTDKGCKIRG